MKRFLFTLVCLAVFAPIAFSQTTNVDIEKLKSFFASSAGIKATDIKSAAWLTFGDKHFGYFKYIKDGKPATTAQEYALGGPGGFIPAGGTLTCSGQGCSECDIVGLPNVMDAYCDCVRKAVENGYCNMTKSITIGGK